MCISNSGSKYPKPYPFDVFLLLERWIELLVDCVIRQSDCVTESCVQITLLRRYIHIWEKKIGSGLLPLMSAQTDEPLGLLEIYEEGADWCCIVVTGVGVLL